MPGALAAEFRHTRCDGCLEGTRKGVLNKIELWTKDFNNHPIFWLNGLAGTGKTAIAQTIAERMFKDGRLGASFFCSRNPGYPDDPSFIFPILAVQLARRYPEIQSILVPLLRSNPEISRGSLYDQMNQMVVGPLRASDISTVIIIDALDRCGNSEDASATLSAIGQLASQIPKVKFFLTSRPEPRIWEGFRLPPLVEATDVFVLHDVEPSIVNDDIRLFLERSCMQLVRRRDVPEDWLTTERLDLLCGQAEGLFFYAAATVKFIDSSTSKQRLDRLLEPPESSSLVGKTKVKPLITLDPLYGSILREAFGLSESRGDSAVRLVLGTVALAASPVSPSTITALLGLCIEKVFSVLLPAYSLFILQEDIDRPIRPFHKSFPDFIVDPTRCTNPRFRVSPLRHHPKLLIGCLGLMARRLEKNMCKLPDGVSNSEVDDLQERAERYIDPALRYACESWYKHIVYDYTAPITGTVCPLQRFLGKSFLFWLEVLSILGGVGSAVAALESAKEWLTKVCLVSGPNN